MGLRPGRSGQPAIAVIVAAGFALAACSSGSSDSSAPHAGTSTPAAHHAAGDRPSRGHHPSQGASKAATSAYRPDRATVIGQSTDVAVNPAVSAALHQDGVAVTAVAPATATSTLLFPVSGGQIVAATLAGTVQHTGGLTFRHGTKRVTLTDLVINTRTKHLTATVGGRSMPVFGLDLPSPAGTSSGHQTVVANDIELTVLPQAATALNSGLGVRTFTPGLSFGKATLTVAYARGHR
jgi:hypothetical protein